MKYSRFLMVLVLGMPVFALRAADDDMGIGGSYADGDSESLYGDSESSADVSVNDEPVDQLVESNSYDSDQGVNELNHSDQMDSDVVANSDQMDSDVDVNGDGETSGDVDSSDEDQQQDFSAE